MKNTRIYPILSASAIAALLATGCAGVRWHKEGTDAAALDRDLVECQARARVRSAHEAGPVLLPRPGAVGMDARGRVVMDQTNAQETDRVLLEHDLTRACMGEKGYQLVSAKKQ